MPGLYDPNFHSRIQALPLPQFRCHFTRTSSQSQSRALLLHSVSITQAIVFDHKNQPLADILGFLRSTVGPGDAAALVPQSLSPFLFFSLPISVLINTCPNSSLTHTTLSFTSTPSSLPHLLPLTTLPSFLTTKTPFIWREEGKLSFPAPPLPGYRSQFCC